MAGEGPLTLRQVRQLMKDIEPPSNGRSGTGMTTSGVRITSRRVPSRCVT
jgi:hypothetical protein